MESPTILYAGLTALLFSGLSVNVSRLRGKYKTQLGDNSEQEVLTAVRAHGNCAEYFGVLFLLMLFAEMMHAGSTVLHCIGGGIFFTRVLHAFGVLAKNGAAHVTAASLNYLALFGLSGYVLYLRLL